MKASILTFSVLWASVLALPPQHEAVKRDSTLGPQESSGDTNGCKTGVTGGEIDQILKNVTPEELAKCLAGQAKAKRAPLHSDITPTDVTGALKGISFNALAACLTRAEQSPGKRERSKHVIPREEIIGGVVGDVLGGIVSGLQELLDKLIVALENQTSSGNKSNLLGEVLSGVRELLDTAIAGLQGGSSSSKSSGTQPPNAEEEAQDIFSSKSSSKGSSSNSKGNSKGSSKGSSGQS